MRTPWNREQVFAICDEVKKIRDTIPIGREGSEVAGTPRRDAMTALAKRLGIHVASVYDLYLGRQNYSRPWVIEWRKERGLLKAAAHATGTNGDLRVVRKPHSKISDDVVALVQRLHREGLSYSQIERKTGIPEGSLWNLIRHRTVNGATATATATATPAQRNGTTKHAPKRRADLGADFQAFIDAKEEEALLALRTKHDAEEAEMFTRHGVEEKKLREELAARRTQVIDQLVEFWTRPTPQKAATT